MREIVLDTETTGLDPFADPKHRIVEIGAVELWNQVPTGKTYHQYINPERDMPAEAYAVHGLGDEFLSQQPIFADVSQAFLDFIEDAPLVIHNASFDMRFINAELQWNNQATLPDDRAVDTLMIARRKFPGSPASLDALCKRFGIDNSMREKHGALLDSEILAEVYLELSGGRQKGLTLSATSQGRGAGAGGEAEAWRPTARLKPLASRVTDEERDAHQAFVAELGDEALWHNLN